LVVLCDGLVEDIAVKIRVVLQEDFVHAAETGRLTDDLHTFLVQLRLLLPIDTQNLEGVNSLLQVMATRSARMRIPLLNARLSIKKNRSPSAQECANLDGAVSVVLNSDVTKYRFSPIPTPTTPLPDPLASATAPCEHRAFTMLYKSVSLAAQFGRNHEAGAQYAYSVRYADGVFGRAFMMTRRLRLYTHCVLGGSCGDGDARRFRRAVPFEFKSAVDIVKDCFGRRRRYVGIRCGPSLVSDSCCSP
jgi:hypothetical protein